MLIARPVKADLSLSVRCYKSNSTFKVKNGREIQLSYLHLRVASYGGLLGNKLEGNACVSLRMEIDLIPGAMPGKTANSSCPAHIGPTSFTDRARLAMARGRRA